jgi:hypothetical protein
MNIKKFFRRHPEGGRYASTKVDEIEALLTANGGVRTHVASDGEYVYTWNCKGHTVIVNYRGSDWKGTPYAYLDEGLV